MVLCDDFTIISSCSHSIMYAKYLTLAPRPQRAIDTEHRERMKARLADVWLSCSQNHRHCISFRIGQHRILINIRETCSMQSTDDFLIRRY